MKLHTKCLLATVLLTATTSVLFAGPKTMSVQVREGQLRSAPSYLSRIVTKVGYASKVIVLQEKGSWMRVRILGRSKEGWINSSALSEKRLKLSSGKGNATTAVSTEEQALAGKGFNSDVEAKFKADAKINFTWVNKMEKIKIPTPVLIKFLKDGDITPHREVM